jgi:aldose sugar dehydrogenase
MRKRLPSDTRLRSWAGPFGVALIAAGLLVDQTLIEFLLVPDGQLRSPTFQNLLLGFEVVLVVGGLSALAYRGISNLGLVGLAIVVALISHRTVTVSRWQTVIDCRQGGGRCFTNRIDRYYGTSACWQDRTRDCEALRRGLHRITFIADPTNYVEGPLTGARPHVEVIPVDLNEPWDLEFLPDGRMLVTERGGRVVLIERNGSARDALQLEPFDQYESGLMGLAVDPRFSENGYVYLYYTVGHDDSDPRFAAADPWLRRVTSRISRFELRGDSLVGELALLDDIPGSAMHVGGRLEIGADGKLYATTGDAHEEHLAQDLASLAGKILRLNLDGSVPPDNPFPGSYVYSMGHRNPQGLAWHPATGDLYETENGPDRQDELNRILPGGNYGWPLYSCTTVARSAAESIEIASPLSPVRCFEIFTMAPSGITFVSDRESPWYGDLFVAGMRGKHLRRYKLDGDEIVEEDIFFIADEAFVRDAYGVHEGISLRLRDVEYFEGALYVIGDQFGMVRLTPRGE